MSMSSATTLISQTARGTAPSIRSTNSHVHAHGHPTTHGHTHAAMKRRASSHSQHSQGGTSRRSSEGEGGRRALVAGLTMHTLSTGVNGAGASSKGMRRKSSADRPLPKSSRSDTHLPHLSRTTSITSTTSRTSNISHPGRRKSKTPSRHQSDESVTILDDEGKPITTSAAIETEEGWESGEGEEEEAKPAGTDRDPIKRATSDTTAQKSKPIFSPAQQVQSPIGLPESHAHPDHQTSKTTGFTGAVANPDPAVAAAVAQAPTPDQEHAQPAFTVQHRLSAVNLAQQQSVEEVDSGDSGLTAGSGGEGSSKLNAQREIEKTANGAKGDVAPLKERASSQSNRAPLRSTEGSGLPGERGEKEESPHYPFPVQTAQPSQEPTIQNPTPPPSAPRSRVSSGIHPPQQPRTIRHRPSNSSLRSIQSLRAPPHPLNSPTGRTTGNAYAGISRAGGTLNSPNKFGLGDKDHRRRVSSLHYPPIAPAVVYREVATGRGWELPDEDENSIIDIADSNNGRGKTDRSESFNSTRSLQGIINLSKSGSSNSNAPNRNSKLRQTSPTSSTYSQMTTTAPTVTQRLTALSAATAASKLPTTNDPAAYHHSLGYSSTSAETAHLTSRFLPPKKIQRPQWEISLDYNEDPVGRIGISKGGYRDAHEALIRSMKEIGSGGSGGGSNGNGGTGRFTRRQVSRGYSLLSPGVSVGTWTDFDGLGNGDADYQGLGAGVGFGVRGKNGSMVVRRGGWNGKTPFELSIERCLAQRPGKGLLGV